MVKSTSPQPQDLFTLNAAASNVTIPSNIQEAFSLAGVYGDNVAFSSYANLATWQNPWYNNFPFNQAVRVFNSASTNLAQNSISTATITTSTTTLSSDEAIPNTLAVSVQNQCPNQTNELNSTSTLPLAQQLGLSAYNNYLAPGIENLFAQTNPIANTTDLSSSVANNLQIPTLTGNPSVSMLHSLTTQTTMRSNNGRAKSTPKSPRCVNPRTTPTSRSCECPNCLELAKKGLPIDKKNEKHSCHIPGCMKVYGKSSHLKAHLRWHNSSRPSVYQQNRRNGEISHAPVLSQFG